MRAEADAFECSECGAMHTCWPPVCLACGEEICPERKDIFCWWCTDKQDKEARE